jgi:putative DNA primase/helicase
MTVSKGKIDGILGRLESVKRESRGWLARCPAHDDRTPSLSISEGDNGCVLLHCHAGCTLEAVTAALNMTPADLFADNGNGKREVVAEYPYQDEDGQLLYQVVRYSPKGFRQRRLDGNGGWIWKLGDTRRVLYRLRKVIETAKAGGTVYVVEGEKDVHAVEAAGGVATCNPGGAGKWRDEYSESLRGAHVIIFADKDEPGRQHAAAVAASVAPVAASVRLTEAAVGKDAADHLGAGKMLEEFLPVDLAAPAPGEDPGAAEGTAGDGGKAFHLTELGNAERLAARHAGSVFTLRTADELRAYDPARGIYSAEHGLLVRYAVDVVRSMYSEAGDELGDAAKDLRRHAARSETKRSLDAMLSLAKSLESLEAEVSDFDADHELLNTTNGVVDLRNGDLHPHDPKYRMTKITGCGYDPGAPTPMWDAFLKRIFAGDQELVAFMQRLFGYALTGFIGEQIFAIFFGAGANGKSVLVDSWHAAMGDYAGTAAIKTFLPHRTETVRTDLATFCGKRLVSASESKAGQVVDAATIKVMTSKHVTCRFNYQRGEFTYTPNYLVILDTNFKPLVQCDDYAIKRRVLLVPFDVLIPEAERDTKLIEKLVADELPGILAWGVKGACDYLANGLRIPETVRAATDEYRAEMDQMHEFWGQWLVFGEAGTWTAAEALRDVLETWAKVNGVETRDLPKGAEWGRQLRERGAVPGKKWIGTKTVSVWYGVQIVGADAQEELM